MTPTKPTSSQLTDHAVDRFMEFYGAFGWRPRPAHIDQMLQDSWFVDPGLVPCHDETAALWGIVDRTGRVGLLVEAPGGALVTMYRLTVPHQQRIWAFRVGAPPRRVKLLGRVRAHHHGKARGLFQAGEFPQTWARERLRCLPPGHREREAGATWVWLPQKFQRQIKLLVVITNHKTIPHGLARAR